MPTDGSPHLMLAVAASGLLLVVVIVLAAIISAVHRWRTQRVSL